MSAWAGRSFSYNKATFSIQDSQHLEAQPLDLRVDVTLRVARSDQGRVAMSDQGRVGMSDQGRVGRAIRDV